MIPIETSGYSQLIAGVIVIIVGIIYGLQKLPRTIKDSKVEGSLVEMMHKELIRLSSQNTLLSTELNKLQIEILKLTKELNNLTIENQKLTEEIRALNSEIDRMHKLLGER